MKLTMLRKLSLTDWFGAVLTALGTTQLLADMAGFASESDAFYISGNMALCFLLAGAAFLAQSLNALWRRRLQMLCGCVLLVLTALEIGGAFAETFLQTAWSSYVPELALNTTVIIALAGFIFVSIHSVRWRSAGNVLHLSSIVIILFSVVDLIDNLLGLDILYVWYRYQDLSFISAVGVFLLGLGLYSLIQRQPWYKDLGLDREDRKISIISAVLLTVFAFSCGLMIFSGMSHQTEEAFKNNLMTSLESRVRIFKSSVDTAIGDAVFHSRRTRLAALLNKISAGDGTAEDRDELDQTLERILSMSWGHISAITFYNHAGKKIAQRGKFVTDSEFNYALPVKQKAMLRWNNGFVLNIEVNYSEDKHISFLSVDIPMEKVNALFNELSGLGKTAAMAVCAPADERYLTCPSSPKRTHRWRIPRYLQGDVPSAGQRALKGETGVAVLTNDRDKDIIAAYAPVGELGLAMIVKVDKAELYLPIRARFEHMLLTMVGLVILGVALLRWQIVPLVRKLLNEINERKRAEEESGLLQAISQAVGGARDIHAALEIVLSQICEATGWKLGQAWVPRSDDAVLECSSAWYSRITGAEKFRLVNQGLTFGPDRGLPGRAWRSKTPVWMRDLTQSKTSRRGRLFAEMGIRAGTAIPILAGEEVVAVMEFLTPEMHPEDTRLVALISSVAAQLGVVIQRERAQIALNAIEERYRTLIHNCVEAIYLYDPETKRLLEANAAFLNLLGYTAQEVTTLSMHDFINHSDESIEAFSAPLKTTGGMAIGERIWRSKDGRLITMDVTAGGIWKGNNCIGFTVARDITAQKLAEERLNYLAHYDELTGLSNRMLFNEHLHQILVEAGRRQRLAAVMFLDLDRFKTINDTLGHEMGDTLLKAVAERLRDCVRRGDVVARLGGDEFTFALADVAQPEDVVRVAKKILDSFSEPFHIGGRDLFVTTSIGIALYPGDHSEVEGLLKNADAAMYRAKERGRNNYQFYTQEMNAKAFERLTLEIHLRRALERQEFVLHYQPQVDLTGKMVGMEALIRWQSPELGLIPPATFIPLAEETGLIVPIGEWVMHTACVQNKAWHDAGSLKLRISVNLSTRQFYDKNLVETVRRVLAQTGLESNYLELELTESMLQNMDAAEVVLQELNALGVLLSVDDFGTGYSSFSYLKRFPIDNLKIDRSFVRDVTTDPDDAAITGAIISMAHTLGIQVVAEGVETREQLTFLQQHKCDLIQGYYFSKPLPVGAFTELLRAGQRLTPSVQRIPPDTQAASG